MLNTLTLNPRKAKKTAQELSVRAGCCCVATITNVCECFSGLIDNMLPSAIFNRFDLSASNFIKIILIYTSGTSVKD
jgi:hypothetical protein